MSSSGQEQVMLQCCALSTRKAKEQERRSQVKANLNRVERRKAETNEPAHSDFRSSVQQAQVSDLHRSICDPLTKPSKTYKLESKRRIRRRRLCARTNNNGQDVRVKYGESGRETSEVGNK
jgi:hypothetical protein